MAIDTSAAGQQIAAQMEAIEKDFEEQDGYKLGAIVTIVGIDAPEGGTSFRIRSNAGNPAMTLGVMRMAEDEFILALRQGAPPPAE
ncbi:MAG TPA: hypothetical protein VND98_02660 [Solirubrobacterales bacterium]|nr:hypothetical protein [Solirubrobacterales bacterium]